jgi:hypothetical protein
MKIGIILSKEIEKKISYRNLLIKEGISFYEIEKLPHLLTDQDIPNDMDLLIVLGVHSLRDYGRVIRGRNNLRKSIMLNA